MYYKTRKRVELRGRPRVWCARVCAFREQHVGDDIYQVLKIDRHATQGIVTYSKPRGSHAAAMREVHLKTGLLLREAQPTNPVLLCCCGWVLVSVKGWIDKNTAAVENKSQKKHAQHRDVTACAASRSRQHSTTQTVVQFSCLAELHTSPPHDLELHTPCLLLPPSHQTMFHVSFMSRPTPITKAPYTA